MKKKKSEVKAMPKSDIETILPKKDHVISFNKIHIELKKGVEAKVPLMFLSNLKTENVI